MKKEGKAAKNYHSLRKSFVDNNRERVPPVTTEVHSTTDGTRTIFTGLSVLKRRITKGRIMRQISKIEVTALRDIVRKHKKHAGKRSSWKTVDLSIDGVPEAKSGSNDLVIISVSFVGCGVPVSIQLRFDYMAD